MALPRSPGGASLWIVGVLAVASTALAAEPVLLSMETPAIVETPGMSSVRLEGIQGTISVRAAKPGEMRYAARSLDNRREERSLALWQDGRDFVLRPDPSAAAERLLVEIMVPRELLLEIDLVESRLDISVLGGDLLLRSRNSEIDARGLDGESEFEIEGGTLKISDHKGSIHVHGRDFEARLARGNGPVTLDVVHSVVEVIELESGLQADLDESALVVNGVRHLLQVNADRSTLDLRALHSGGEFQLGETPLVLAGINGSFTVETDSDVRFSDIQAELKISSFGGNVHGSGNAGSVKINTYNAEVVLDTIGGTVELEGDNLKVRLETLKDALVARTLSSSLTVIAAEGAIDIENEFGDVQISGASGSVRVVNLEGDTRISGLSGPLDLRADGNSVEVGWSKVAGEASRIQNESGEVRVGLPEGGGYRFSAETRSGRIHSELPDVSVSDDGRSASGGGRASPRGGSARSGGGGSIQVNSGSDIYLERSKAPQPSGAKQD